MCSRSGVTHWSLDPGGLRWKPGTCFSPTPFLPFFDMDSISPGFLYALDLLPLPPQELGSWYPSFSSTFFQSGFSVIVIVEKWSGAVLPIPVTSTVGL